MAKIKFTKNELKRQKESLQRFQRYLPTLLLKKQQLQLERLKIEHKIREIRQQRDSLKKEIEAWIAVFAEPVDFAQWFRPKKILTQQGNIAGIDIPVFDRLTFDEQEYDFFKVPFWVDRGIEVCKQIAEWNAHLLVLEHQRKLILEELRITSQRVNLFEKVKIPDAKENIRVIRIYLGDRQTEGVVRGKMAKAKIG